MSDLFQKTVPTINEHIKNVFLEQELAENSTIRKFLIVQKEDNREVAREIDFYNLDVIISVGYRVKSHKELEQKVRLELEEFNRKQALMQLWNSKLRCSDSLPRLQKRGRQSRQQSSMVGAFAIRDISHLVKSVL